MNSRRVWITGVGPVSALGVGIDANWGGALAGASAIASIEAFDASEFACSIAGEVRDFNVRDYVPKTYRKATKVMARDIELAVAAADAAARDAGIATSGTDPDGERTYDPTRVGAHIGAGLIAADVDELTAALSTARVAEGSGGGDFDMHKWGAEGMFNLTPLWLLKYLPNMLACHVTIIHDTQGPSNTITCAEASSGLSVGESLRVIQRGQADLCFCGGAESKINPMAFYRQVLTGRLNTADNDNPAGAVRPFDKSAAGTVIGEGGGIVILEAAETFEKRGNGRVYAEVAGFGASQSVDRESRNREPATDGRAIAAAMRAALREAGITPDDIDAVFPFGSGAPRWDAAEAGALRLVFGDRLASVPVMSVKALVGNCGAGAGGIDLALAAKAIAEQKLPKILNRANPLDGMSNGQVTLADGTINNVLVFTTGYGGQNTAIVLRKI